MAPPQCRECKKRIPQNKYICDECSTSSNKTTDSRYQDYHSSGKDENGESY